MTDSLRERMFALATEAVGLGYGRANKGEYLDLIAAGEDDRTREALGRVSSCGLVVRGLWARLGLDDPRLRAPYKIGSVIATIVDMARECNARFSVSDTDLPRVGDVALVDIDSAKAHVATVVGVKDERPDGATDPTWAVYTVDGGQRDGAGAELILRRRRLLTLTLKGQAMLAPGDAYGLGTRALSGVIDLEALAARFLPGGAT